MRVSNKQTANNCSVLSGAVDDSTLSAMENVTSDIPEVIETNSSGTTIPEQPSVFVIFIYLVIAILICVGNTMVIILVAASPPLQTVTNILLVNLALADATIGVLSLVGVYASVWPQYSMDNTVECHFRIWTVALVVLVSCSTLFGRLFFVC